MYWGTTLEWAGLKFTRKFSRHLFDAQLGCRPSPKRLRFDCFWALRAGGFQGYSPKNQRGELLGTWHPFCQSAGTQRSFQVGACNSACTKRENR